MAANSSKARNWFNLWLIAAGCGLMLYVLFGTSVLQGFRNAGKTNLSEQSEKLKQKSVRQIGIVQDRRLTEISGIDSSLKYPDCYWVHNDSGNPADVFLISSSGYTLAKVNLSGAVNVDWEDITVCELNGKPYICIADVGDNQGKRKQSQLYLLEEPELEIPLLDNLTGENVTAPTPIEIETKDFKKLDFRFAGGPRNCEAMAIYGNHRNIYLFEKAKDQDSDSKPAGIFKLRLRIEDLNLLSNVAKRVADAKSQITTAADLHSDGKRLLASNYVTCEKYTRKLAASWDRELYSQDSVRFGLPVQRQGEAICFSADGKSAIVVSEFGNQPIWSIDIELAIDASNPNNRN